MKSSMAMVFGRVRAVTAISDSGSIIKHMAMANMSGPTVTDTKANGNSVFVMGKALTLSPMAMSTSVNIITAKQTGMVSIDGPTVTPTLASSSKG